MLTLAHAVSDRYIGAAVPSASLAPAFMLEAVAWMQVLCTVICSTACKCLASDKSVRADDDNSTMSNCQHVKHHHLHWQTIPSASVKFNITAGGVLQKPML
eukprot:1150399-Pelagomonas_calceolata.AAC.3